MRRKVLSLTVLLILMVSIFAGCGASKSTDNTAPATESVSKNADYSVEAKDSDGSYGQDAAGNPQVKGNAGNGGNGVIVTAKKDHNTAEGIIETGSEGSKVSNAIISQRKIIRNANVSIQVDNYDKTYGKIQSMVEYSGYGYIQQSKVSKQNTDTKSGMVVVRVQADKFSDILNSIKGLGEVIDANETTDDVTEKFYDVESELRLLKYEQSRLEQYLNKITDPDTIFKTESRLTEIRHQIEGLTGTLNKLSDLVKLSTITININEKNPDSNKVSDKEASYWGKLANGFMGSLKGVADFFASLILVLVQVLPILILIALFIWIGFKLYRRLSKTERKSENIIKEENNKDDTLQL